MLGAPKNRISKCIAAHEIDPVQAAEAARRLALCGVTNSEQAVRSGDFFASFSGPIFEKEVDVVLGNPPFIRYQSFPEDQRQRAFQLMRRAGLTPNRLTNAWVPFVVAACLRLKPSGRLALVVPAEVLQVNYAAELRLFLSNFFRQIRVITFRRLTFKGIQQEVVLLLADRGADRKQGIEVHELESLNSLTTYKAERFGKNGLKPIDHTKDKWTQYFLSEREIDFLRELRAHSGLTQLGSVASTDVGVVTGMNEFFILSANTAEGMSRFCRPVVARSAHLSGVVFSPSDWDANRSQGLPALLLDAPPLEMEKLSKTLQRYIRDGEAKGLNLGYKCRIREKWYCVPSTYSPDAFLLRQIHGFPKMVANLSGATSTDTIHRVRLKSDIEGPRLASAFLNVLTFAFSEVLGRSYGGGVLELEPNEADRIPIPLNYSEKLPVMEIDGLVRRKDILAALKITSRELLLKGLGLTGADVDTLHTIWAKLRDRRIGRREKPEQESLRLSSDVGLKALVAQEVSLLNLR